eukprot:CAMPEP_0182426192 /NCGR_PEP_ID=MMETSP1167-20130531/12680_1 /TAXON_ID=2988 /ORGANISM="Mallomonas Sp, Strain CCMP3275" /LENGTH=413 /DNA_ID=CAMNT_0024607457 /DNA_START=186 /DNA_END=1427 /DNA_ORIENTATION=+
MKRFHRKKTVHPMTFIDPLDDSDISTSQIRKIACNRGIPTTNYHYFHDDLYSFVGMDSPSKPALSPETTVESETKAKSDENVVQVSSQHFQSVDHLITIPKWIESKYNGFTPLQIALIERDAILVKKLLDAGANPKFKMPEDDDVYVEMFRAVQYFVRFEKYPKGYFGHSTTTNNATNNTNTMNGKKSINCENSQRTKKKDVSKSAKSIKLSILNQDKNKQKDEKTFQSPSGINEVVQVATQGFDAFTQTSSDLLQIPSLKPVKEISKDYRLHGACRVGDEHNLLTLLVTRREDVWQLDDFDNYPIYYAILYGHIICCAWMLIAMEGTKDFPEIELERCIINALNADIKHLLQGKLSPHDVIKNKADYESPETLAGNVRRDPSTANTSVSAPFSEDEVGLADLFGFNDEHGDY